MMNVAQIFNEQDYALLTKRQAPSSCPFLNLKEVEFLDKLHSRTDTMMFDSYSLGPSPERHHLTSLGYTDEVHAEFKRRIEHPQTMTQEFLTPVLEALQDTYGRILHKEFEAQKTISSAYESWFNVTPINLSTATTIGRELKSLGEDNGYCLGRISTLVSINNNIRALLMRPVRAEVTPHPVLERTA